MFGVFAYFDRNTGSLDPGRGLLPSAQARSLTLGDGTARGITDAPALAPTPDGRVPLIYLGF